MKPRIALTIGDFNGIAPEVILKNIDNAPLLKTIEPVLVGSLEVFDYYAKRLKTKKKLVAVQSPKERVAANAVPVINAYNGTAKNLQIGKAAPDAGICAGMAVERSVRMCLDGEVDALVTGPVSKESLHIAGYNFPGQTEMLAMLSRSNRVTMMLIAKSFRVGLATIHIPIQKVSENIFAERIIDKLETIDASLKRDFRIAMPSIAVLALNPHAGEHGAIGLEEIEVIEPAILKAKEKGINASGPFPADGFFATSEQKKYDAVLAMYHDQGLIPLKMTGFNEGVNFSAGLNIIRTSPDHGTAFNIAGKGIADPRSMNAAIQLARTIVLNRKK
ncbi:MAG TPA: 4-hydroxythreonine-4-phosphate dehydrogenase PdxA [Bacteroidota bacterium]|nr:4-hydroxythreonine-4-phosphate dehydrogenase PdxA [Bacteroidota bacterium]